MDVNRVMNNQTLNMKFIFIRMQMSVELDYMRNILCFFYANSVLKSHSKHLSQFLGSTRLPNQILDHLFLRGDSLIPCSCSSSQETSIEKRWIQIYIVLIQIKDHVKCSKEMHLFADLSACAEKQNPPAILFPYSLQLSVIYIYLLIVISKPPHTILLNLCVESHSFFNR